MKLDLGRLRINRVIAHEVPLKTSEEDSHSLVFSEVESPLTQGNKNFFKERIVRSLASAAFDIVADPNSSSPVPDYIHQLISIESSDFIGISQDMARHLYSCQNRVNSAGIFSLVQASIQQVPVLVVLKLEKEQGIRVHQERIHGQRTFAIEQFTDLMMTDGTKVFKVGLLYNFGDTPASVEGRVSDKQRGYEVGISDFFLRKFLGCKFREAPDIITKSFFHSTQDFINSNLSQPQTKASYTVALIATMSNQEKTISPNKFAEVNMEVSDRDKYIQFLNEKGIPIHEFEKDTTQIKNHIRKVQIDFRSGILLLAQPDTFDKHVKVTNIMKEIIFLEPESLDALPGRGKSLIIVSKIEGTFYIRIFDEDGEKVFDGVENSIYSNEPLIKKLNAAFRTQNINQDDKVEIIGELAARLGISNRIKVEIEDELKRTSGK